MQSEESMNPTPISVTIPLIEYESRGFLFNNRGIIDRIDRRLRSNPVLGPQIARWFHRYQVLQMILLLWSILNVSLIIKQLSMSMSFLVTQ